MQSAGLPAVEFEKKLLDSADKSVLFGAVVATNLEQAVALRSTPHQPPRRGQRGVASPVSLPRTRRASWRSSTEIKDQPRPASRFADPDPSPVDLAELSRTLVFPGRLSRSRPRRGRRGGAGTGATIRLVCAVTIANCARGCLRGTGRSGKPAPASWPPSSRRSFDDVQRHLRGAEEPGQRPPRCALQDLPDALAQPFYRSDRASTCCMVYPRKDVWQRENQKEFIEQVARPCTRKSPARPCSSTNTPSCSSAATRRPLGIRLIAIVILVLVHFRSALCVVLALVPVGVGFLWLGGIMGHSISRSTRPTS